MIGQQVDWLRRLARSLVHDVSLAEDLVQETALAALQAPPVLSDGSPRPWLARVLQRRAADAARGARGRGDLVARREEEIRAKEAASSAEGLLHEVETGKRLSELVLGLSEPTRSTMLLRFWEDLPPRKIARRQGVPIATVKSRLARGLERLRAELDHQSGGSRSSWLLAVLPMARNASSSATFTVLGGIGMNAKVLSLATGAALIGGTLYLAAPPSAPAEGPLAAEVEEAASPGELMSPGASREAAGRQALVSTPAPGLSAASASPGGPEEPSSESPLHSIEGQVLRADAVPLAGVTIQGPGGDSARAGASTQAGATALSGAQGRFVLETTFTAGSLEAAPGGDWVTVRPGAFRAGSEDTPIVIVASAIDLGGAVVDDWGAPVPGIEVILDLPEDFVTRFNASQARSIRKDWRAITTDEGRFAMAGVPAVVGATLEATSMAGASTRIAAPMTSQDGLQIMLAEPPIPGDTRLTGRVLLANGTGAAGARIAMGDEMARADEVGRFEIDLARCGMVSELRAIAVGAQPATVVRPGDPVGIRMGWPDEVEVRLRLKSRSMTGVLVDAEGAPKQGARVWLHDPTEFGVLGAYPVRAEGLAAGLDDPFEAARSRGRLRRSNGAPDESSATGVESSNTMLTFAVTDDRGRFELVGLLDRSYVLNVLGPDLSFAFQTEPLRAGERGITLRVPEAGVYEEMRGRLVTRRGDPLPGVFVTPWVTALSKDLSVQGGSSSVTRFFYGGGARSDAEGRFTLRNMPKQHLNFWVAGEGVTPLSVAIEEIDDPVDFEIEMAARIEVSVQIMDLSLGIDGVTAQGFDGSSQDILRLYADGSSNMQRLPIESGRTGVFALTTDADTITLMRGTEPVEVIPLEGDSEEVQEIIR